MPPAERRSIRWMALAAFVLAVALPSVAAAHLNLTDPASRYDKRDIKDAPCGSGTDVRSDSPTTYQAGETITLEWNEYVDHPGHFRVAFDPDGTDDFESPACLSKCSTTDPEIEMYNNETVIADDIEDKQGGSYTHQITLPNVNCERCTLQVIQVMYDKPPYRVGGNDIYYQCADLKLVGATPGDAGDAGPDAGTTTDAEASGGDDASGESSDTRSSVGDETGTAGESDASGLEYDSGEEGSSGASGGESGCATAGAGTPLPVGGAAFVGLVLLTLRRRRDRR